MVSKYAEYELYELLNDVFDKGYVVIYIQKLFRLLGKGNRSQGTWKALLDAWEKAKEGNDRSSLYISELPGEYILITKINTEQAMVLAGEMHRW
jgi:hypothetical protein